MFLQKYENITQFRASLLSELVGGSALGIPAHIKPAASIPRDRTHTERWNIWFSFFGSHSAAASLGATAPVFLVSKLLFPCST